MANGRYPRANIGFVPVPAPVSILNQVAYGTAPTDVPTANRIWTQLVSAYRRHEQTWMRFAGRLTQPGDNRLMKRFYATFWDKPHTALVTAGPTAPSLYVMKQLSRALVAARAEAGRINLPLPALEELDRLWIDFASIA